MSLEEKYPKKVKIVLSLRAPKEKTLEEIKKKVRLFIPFAFEILSIEEVDKDDQSLKKT